MSRLSLGFVLFFMLLRHFAVLFFNREERSSWLISTCCSCGTHTHTLEFLQNVHIVPSNRSGPSIHPPSFMHTLTLYKTALFRLQDLKNFDISSQPRYVSRCQATFARRLQQERPSSCETPFTTSCVFTTGRRRARRGVLFLKRSL